MKIISLREGKERSLLRRHPWVFENSIAKGRADVGETVRVQAFDGRFLAWGAYSPASQIRVRAWSFDEAERIDDAFFLRRIQKAVDLRVQLGIQSDGQRLVHGEADGLPGLVVDRYASTLSAQFNSAGAERWREAISSALMTATGAARLYERSDTSARGQEGLEARTGWLRGPDVDVSATDTPTASTQVTIQEHSLKLTLDVSTGHKTGYYLDQRENRALFAHLIRQHASQTVLNCFAYTGGFSVAALLGGASEVTSVDSSAPALQRASAHVLLNGFAPERHTAVVDDVNHFLRKCLFEKRQFDAIVLDPPKFAPTAAHAERAARAYKDINRLALLLLRPGGLLLTFSCSGGISADLFHKIVAGAALDAQVDGAILRRLEGASDHPTTLTFPEGEYLKGLLILRS